MNCRRTMDRQIFQDQLSDLNPGAHEAVERMVSTIRRTRTAAREARQRGMTPDGVQRPKFDAEVQKTGGPTVRSPDLYQHHRPSLIEMIACFVVAPPYHHAAYER